MRSFGASNRIYPFEILLGVPRGVGEGVPQIFEMYSRPLKITERRYLFGLFLNGLKDDVRAELKFHSFHTLDELIDIAKMVESHNKML